MSGPKAQGNFLEKQNRFCARQIGICLFTIFDIECGPTQCRRVHIYDGAAAIGSAKGSFDGNMQGDDGTRRRAKKVSQRNQFGK